MTQLRGIGRHPWFWTAIVAVLAYSDLRALNGGWVYDDAGSVIKNVVVNGKVDWKQAFTRDYWGTEMREAQSHKSFRPVTTLTLKANWVVGKFLERELTPEELLVHDKQNLPPTWNFHLFNILLHGIVTGLVTKATSLVLPREDVVSQLVVGILFGVHPVHAEVVSNITSRGELLMSVFFLSFFWPRFCPLPEPGSVSAWRKTCGLYVLPWIFMTLSLFSKEQGATALIAVVAWDFLKHHGNLTAALLTALEAAKAERADAREFLVGTLVLAVETLLVIAWRYALNGETSPDFVEAQNPAGFAKDRFTRAFSVTWVYCLYIRDALYPYYLSPDWSGRSIDLITSLTDPRAMAVLALWYFSAQSFWTVAKKIPPNDNWNETTLRQVNTAVWAFTFAPFLLSSNILVVVGLMKADRVIYLPLFGFCLLEALLIGKLRRGAVRMRPALERRREQLFWGTYFFFLAQVIVFTGRTHERNLAWSDSLRLWETAYTVNPRSYHTMYNYGYELSLKQRYAESEAVMRPIGSARVDGPSNTFVYTMVLFNLKQCDRANVLLEDALQVIQEKRAEGGVRNTDSSLNRSESNLLVAKAHCTDDPQERGRILYKSVETDPTNDYAVNLATTYMRQLQMR
eukprot:jgi/Psemu1/260713/estExt_Genewise1Plus.C_4850050